LGAAAGLALLAKFSMLLIGPILALFFLGLLWWAPRKEWKRATLGGHAALVGVAAILVVNAAYFFEHRPLAEADAQWIQSFFPSVSGMVTLCASTLSHILPTDFVLGVLQQFRHNQDGHPAGLLGMYGKFGWWYYFPVAFALKSTIPFLLLSLASITWGVREWVKTRQARFLWMLVPFAVYTIFVLFSRIDIGVRYYLPAYSLLFILSGALLDRLIRLSRARIAGIVIASLLLGWCGIEAVRAYPNYTPYMNQLARAHPHWWYLSDSNVEWGDDVSELASYLHARGETKVRAALLGGFLTLGFYKVEYVDLLGDGHLEDTRYVAIGASFLNGSTIPEYAPTDLRRLNEERINLFDPYRHRVPEAVIGNSIYLYRMHE
jgi:hypothetical protein